MNKTYQITTQGKKDLEKELEDLKSKRGEVADKIATARDFGDLSENAEYDAARQEQGLLETRIAEIEDILQHATIIQSTASDTVGLGSQVELKSSDGRHLTYTIVGPIEANPLEGKISNESPIGKELMDKKVDNRVVIKTSKGAVTYQIEAIR